MDYRVGIIGFGTVGSVLANIFNSSGVVFGVYDVLLEDPARKDIILSRAKAANAPVKDLSALMAENTFIISAVTTQVARDVARRSSAYLKKGQVYIDCNSTSPGIKVNLQEIIQSTEADFVEGVILNAVNPGDTGLHMLIGGERGQEVADFFTLSDIHARFYSPEVGRASTFKMLRSIFSKGVEVLLLEMMVAAKKTGIEKDVWEEIVTFMDSKSFGQIAGTWVKSHAAAYERRFHEMEQVIDTMDEIGVSPILTKATVEYFRQSMMLDLKSCFNTAPSTPEEVYSAISRQLDAKGQ